MVRQMIFAAALLLTISAGAAAQDKEAEAARIVDTAMEPCFKNADPSLAQQMRAMLLIKARAIAADNRPLTHAEQTRAEGMMVSFEDPQAYERLGCITESNSPLADWGANVMWAGVIPNDAIDPAAEAKRVAKICTWAVGASVRDRYAQMVAKYLRWQFIALLEKRKLDPVERAQFQRDRKALNDVIPGKTSQEIVTCITETTKGTPVELRLTTEQQSTKQSTKQQPKKR